MSPATTRISCGRDADLVGDQLRQGRLQPLTVRRAADPGFEKARGVHHQFDPLEARGDRHAPRGKGGTAGAGALGEHRHPETEPAPIGARRLLSRAELGEVDDPRRSLHRLAIAAGVLHDAGYRGVRELGSQVTAPDFERVEPEPGGRAIHQPLHCRGDDGPRHPAIGRHRAGVAGDGAGPRAVLAHPVGPGHVCQRHQRLDPAGGREIRIGADIAEDVGVDRQQSTVRIKRAAQMEALVARMKRGGQIFEPVLDPGDSAGKTPRRPDRDDIFRDQRHLLAEPAADLRRDDAEFGFRDP